MILVFILIASFIIRVINLNYNSPFNDEAIYVVIGRLGVFQYDWSSYNASAWVAGNIFLYPVISALSYMTFGIVGSRFLNVILGVLTVETVFSSTVLLSKAENNYKFIAGIIASTIVGGASVALYVSRLATYDMPSFYFLLLSIYLLLIAQKSIHSIGKWYFFSAVALLFSFAMKIITGLYLPFIILYAYVAAKKVGGDNLFFWKRYYASTIVVGLGLYAITTLGSNIAYLSTQISREQGSLSSILSTIWQNSAAVWGFWIVGSLGLFLQKEWKKWLVLTFGAVFILFNHIISHRLVTLDKHVFITITFLAMIAGVGISNLLAILPGKSAKVVSMIVLTIFLLFFWGFSYVDAQRFNKQWDNASAVMNFLSDDVKPGDKVLAELGPPAILAVYDKDHPVNVTTFDYFSYRKFKGDATYTNAIKDGYFNLIELESEEKGKSALYSRIHNTVKQSINDNYHVIYAKHGYFVYRRNF